MPVGAGIAAVGTIGGAALSSSAAKKAAKTQAQSAQAASDVQLKMFGQTREDLAPYRDYGASATPALSKLLGLSGDSFDYKGYINDPANKDVLANYNNIMSTPQGAAQLKSMGINTAEQYGKLHYDTFGKTENRAIGSGVQAQLESLPGYQFARDQGIKSITNAIGSRGLTGAQAKGIARFVTGLADSTYGEQVSRLTGAAALGENAAAQTGNLATQTGSNVGQALIGAGQATAAGQVGSANAISGGISGLSNIYLANKLLGGGIYGTAAGGGGAAASDLAGLF